MKRLFVIMLAVVLVAFSTISVFAVETKSEKTSETVSNSDDNVIYFQVPASGENAWGDYEVIYCHVWQDGGDEFFTWQTNYEKCTRVKGNLWKYNLDNLNYSRGVTEGLRDDKTYAVIFSDNLGDQTYDLSFSTECIGDTVVCSYETMQNPVNASIYCFVASWKNHSDNYDSIEYASKTQETMTNLVNEPEPKKAEDKALSQNMTMAIIIILSVVVLILAVMLIVKTIKTKSKKK